MFLSCISLLSFFFNNYKSSKRINLAKPTVTPPRIVDFKNKRVNPGEHTTFNCTISAFPTPRQNDITLESTSGKKAILRESKVLRTFKYSRANIFHVNSVAKGEKYTCLMNGIAGKTSLTIPVDLYGK